MNIFISWSGERSKKVAELLSTWIPCVIQNVETIISSKDIDRGVIWFSELSNLLSKSNIGIVCITNENKDTPWILFETGALTKGISANRVCTFLVDLIPANLESPLAEFNHTIPDKESMFSLLTTINKYLEIGKLKDGGLKISFDKFWDSFLSEYNSIISTTSDTYRKKLSSEEMFEKIMNELINDKRSIGNHERMDWASTLEAFISNKKFLQASEPVSEEHKKKYYRVGALLEMAEIEYKELQQDLKKK